MSASMSISSNRMRTDLNPCLRCLRWWRIRCAAGEGERGGGILLIVLLDATRHLVYELPYRCRYAHRRPARLGSSKSWSPHRGPCRASIGQPKPAGRPGCEAA
jgi:hypothetical protein